MRADWVKNIGSRPTGRDLGVLVYEKLDMNHQVNCSLACINRGVASRSREVTVLLCSALGRPHLECCIQLWNPQHKKDIDVLE